MARSNVPVVNALVFGAVCIFVIDLVHRTRWAAPTRCGSPARWALRRSWAWCSRVALALVDLQVALSFGPLVPQWTHVPIAIGQFMQGAWVPLLFARSCSACS